MMFLVIFGSLAAAMAVVAQGNLRTADSSLSVSRAMSAAETGLVFAARRLDVEAGRFVVDKGIIDATFGDDLWMGTYGSGDGSVTVLPPTGYTETTPPTGIVYALANAHSVETHYVDPSASPTVDGNGTLFVPAIALSTATPTRPSSRFSTNSWRLIRMCASPASVSTATSRAPSPCSSHSTRRSSTPSSARTAS